MIIGLTGGIASGKSAATTLFASRGAQIIDTDELARQVVRRGSEGLRRVIEHFGDTFRTSRGGLNRARLRARVFADPEERVQLERILHPLIRAKACARLERRQGPYTILVVPLLLESGMTDLVERILVVDVPMAIQRQRLLARTPAAGEHLERIFAAQASRAARLTRADDIIDNSGSLAELDAAVEHLHARYLRLSQPPT